MKAFKRLSVAVFCIFIWIGTAFAALNINEDVIYHGQDIGDITAHSEMGGWPGSNPDREGVVGNFTTTMKNPDGTTMTLAQLEAALHQDHFNWFQKVLSLEPNPFPLKNPDGSDLKPPFIDPPKGGYQGQPDDDKPWYLTEPGELAGATHGSILDFSDGPQDGVGFKATFVTFLISDYGNNVYDHIAGFTWTAERDATTGLTKITSITKNAEWKSDYDNEIKKEFGYSLPESSGMWACSIAAAALFGMRRTLCSHRC